MTELRKEPVGDNLDQRLSRLLDTLEKKPKRTAKSRVGYIENNYDKLILAITEKNWTYKDLCAAMNDIGISIKLSTFKRTMLRIKRQHETKPSSTPTTTVEANRGDNKETNIGQKDAARKPATGSRRRTSVSLPNKELAAHNLSLIGQ